MCLGLTGSLLTTSLTATISKRELLQMRRLSFFLRSLACGVLGVCIVEMSYYCFAFDAADISVRLYTSAFDGDLCTAYTILVSGGLFCLDLAWSLSIRSLAVRGSLMCCSIDWMRVFHQYWIRLS
jgi:hypothetical protein